MRKRSRRVSGQGSELGRLGKMSLMSWAAFAVLVIAVLIGGASRLHDLRLAAVELASLPLLVLALHVRAKNGAVHTAFAGTLVLLTVALPLFQLIPLPPGIWSSIPGRAQSGLALELSGIAQGWLPLSLSPDKTWKSTLALIPPVAAFLAVSTFPTADRLRMIYLILGLVVLSVFMGAAQLTSGGDRLYFWPTTSPGNVVGFFANRNHLATFCLLSLPFAAALGGRNLRRNPEGDRLVLWLSVLFTVLMIIGLAVIRSRMGIILLAPTLAASLLVAWLASGGGRPKPLIIGLAGGAAAALVVAAIFAAAPVMDRFDTTTGKEGRFENWPTVLSAANTYLPLGSGIGSFDQVYRSVEPLARLDSSFFNQAHNEFLETWLEAGWLGAALIVAFMVWFARRSWAAFRQRPSTESDIQKAASVAIVVVVLHSFVDYPLRTETVAVVFAICCALLEGAGTRSASTARETGSAPDSSAELNADRRTGRRRSQA